MSSTVVLTMRRVRQIMQDLSPSNYAVRTERIWEVLARRTQFVSARIGVQSTWNAGYVTLVPGITEYTLTTAKYGEIIAARGSLDGRMLWRLSPSALEEQRTGNTIPQGEPFFFAVIENMTQGVQLRLSSKPVLAETLDLLAGFIPDYLFDMVNATGPTAMEASVLPFSDWAMRALELEIAAECVGAITEEERARLGLADGVEDGWMAQASEFLDSEKERRAYLKRPSAILVRES